MKNTPLEYTIFKHMLNIQESLLVERSGTFALCIKKEPRQYPGSRGAGSRTRTDGQRFTNSFSLVYFVLSLSAACSNRAVLVRSDVPMSINVRGRCCHGCCQTKRFLYAWTTRNHTSAMICDSLLFAFAVCNCQTDILALMEIKQSSLLIR